MVAEITNQSVDQIVSMATDSVLVSPANVPPNASSELIAMQVLSDRQVRRATRSTLSRADQRRLRFLNEIAGSRKLAQDEAEEQEALLESFRRSVVRRSAALAVLRMRGLVVPDIDGAAEP